MGVYLSSADEGWAVGNDCETKKGFCFTIKTGTGHQSLLQQLVIVGSFPGSLHLAG